MRNAALKYRVIIFYAAAFAIAWFSWFVMSRVYDGRQPSPVVYLFSTLGGLAPLIALAVLERLTHKEVSLRGILSQIRLRGTRPLWFLLAVFALPAITLLGNVGSHLLDPDSALRWIRPGPDELGASVVLIMAVHFAASLVTSPLFEEPGWRGFALPIVQGRLGRLWGSLVVGVLWWAWHQPMNLTFGLQPSVHSFLSMLGLSFVIDSLFNLSGRNLLVAMLAHQSSGTVLAFLHPGTAVGLQLGLLLAFVIALRLFEHARPLPPRHAEGVPGSPPDAPA